MIFIFILESKNLSCDIENFNIFYSSDFIDDTQNVRSFGKANLWASIGGYVGMILGFSFLNVPDIVLNMINYVKSKALISNESASFNKDIQKKV